MEYQNIKIQKDSPVFIITINREDKLNALNKLTLSEIGMAICEAENDETIGGLIITGAGKKAFAAGADISEFKNMNVENGRSFAANGHKIMNKIENCSKPIIGAVNGYALGGGCELAMACHLRITSPNAIFGQPEANLGLIPGYGGTQRLIQYLGKAKAVELLMTTDNINAEDALQLGLVNHVVPLENLIPKCKEVLEKIASKSPLAIAKIIRCANAYFASDVDAFKTEVEEFGNCFGTEDYKEGVSAFLEKRKAVFSGK